jgi:hypothetical protein
VDYSQEQIETAIVTSVQNGKTSSSAIYGDGKAGVQIADLLADLPLQFHKTIMY